MNTRDIAPVRTLALQLAAAAILAPITTAQPITENAILTASDAFARSFFGSDIDIQDGLAIIAASGLGSPSTVTEGRVYLFDLTTETEIAQLSIPQDIPSALRQVMGVELVNNTALVGTRRWNSIGAYSNQLLVYDITDPSNPTLLLEYEPISTSNSDDFGIDIDAVGNIAVVGQPFFTDTGSAQGAARIIDFANPAAPVERSLLLAADAAPIDFFGEAVAADDNRALIGAPRESTNATNAGAAYLFDITDPDNPVQLAKLIPPTGDTNDFFGDDVAISGDIAIVSAFFDDDMGLDAGAVWVFDISNPSTPAIAAKIVNPNGVSGDRFGWRIALEGTTAVITEVIGDLPASETGNAFVYDLSDPTNPTLTQTLIASDADFLHFLGDAAAISGNTILLGSERRQAAIPFDGAVYLYRDATAEPCPGDTNGDNAVTPLDISIVLGAFGTTGLTPNTGGDVTGDGSVTPLDISTVLGAFGTTCP